LDRFSLFCADLSNAIIYSRTFNFADGTATLYSDVNPKRIKKRVNIDLKILLKWPKANKIQLNVAKTEVIILKQKQKNSTYDIKIKLDGKCMRFSRYTEYLGILIDENISMAEHTKSIAIKLRKANGAISKIRHYVPINLLRSIYFALFSSPCSLWPPNLGTKSFSKLSNYQASKDSSSSNDLFKHKFVL